MTKADLVERVTAQISRTAGPMISKKDCARVVDAFLEAIKESLQTQENIEVRGFGTFKIRNRKTRMARNPRTGSPVEVSARPVRSSSRRRSCERWSREWICRRCRKHKDLASLQSRRSAHVSTVTVQLFASYAESFGGSTLEIPLGPHSTVEDVVESIRSLPGAFLLPESLRVAVNRKFAFRLINSSSLRTRSR